MKSLYAAVVISLLASCKTSEQKSATDDIGSIESMDPAFSNLVSDKATFEVLGEGYVWSEGPVWIPQHKMLLFSDVPNNVVHKWTEEKGVEVYLKPSGFTGEKSISREPGSNGLALSPDGKLVLCQHGDRRVAAMDADLSAPQAKFVSLADNYKGKKLSSPNDVTFRKNGDLFFTDPPYGLPTQSDSDSLKEQPHNGVYKASAGQVTLLVDSITRPNGIEFLPGQKTLIIANSDPERVRWYALDLNENDSVTSARIFYDATSNSKAGEGGLPDGLAVDKQGNVYATGPGGIWVFNSQGKPLGRIRLSNSAANCELSDDEKTLFITNHMYLVRVRMRE
jgi:gluconolactonase